MRRRSRGLPQSGVDQTEHEQARDEDRCVAAGRTMGIPQRCSQCTLTNTMTASVQNANAIIRVRTDTGCRSGDSILENHASFPTVDSLARVRVPPGSTRGLTTPCRYAKSLPRGQPDRAQRHAGCPLEHETEKNGTQNQPHGHGPSDAGDAQHRVQCQEHHDVGAEPKPGPPKSRRRGDWCR